MPSWCQRSPGNQSASTEYPKAGHIEFPNFWHNPLWKRSPEKGVFLHVCVKNVIWFVLTDQCQASLWRYIRFHPGWNRESTPITVGPSKINDIKNWFIFLQRLSFDVFCTHSLSRNVTKVIFCVFLFQGSELRWKMHMRRSTRRPGLGSSCSGEVAYVSSIH